ncbi:MAG: MotA/TolQ/ExbB proton channel family protein [Planctomycetes bacterium]|nr:MotA/TolQ/ExbB proton channel family protein [Planctomycetota bacterium]
MYPILIMGIIACGVIIERFRSLHLLASDGAEIRTQVRQLLQEDRIEEALELCDSAEGPVAAILAAGVRKFLLLRRLDYDAARIEEQVVKAMEDYSVHVVSALEKHLPILATISSVAPMMGFLGTVAGMITSFKQIVAKMGEMNIVESAAGGISVALLTTAFGLIIGIPAFMFFNYFSGVINRFVLEVEESATELIEVVTLHLALERKEAEAGVPKSSGAEITEFGSDDDEEPSPETEEELSRR